MALKFGDNRSIIIRNRLIAAEDEITGHKVPCIGCGKKKYVRMLPYLQQLRMCALILECTDCKVKFEYGLLDDTIDLKAKRVE